MSVASHLGIETAEYDQQILTFIPHYDEILDAATRALDAVDRPVRTLLDLGIGSGALAGRCLQRRRGVRVVGIDSDPAMLAMARQRLGRRLTSIVGNFESTPFPACDVVTASFALHHIATPAAKGRVFRRVFAALRPGGLLIDADSHLSSAPKLLKRDYDAWRAHLAATHGPNGARRFMRAWAGEDTYFPLELETRLLRQAGFTVDVVWRKDAFAVIAATKPKRR
jgi:tRNA (cmo5U34)-methyltransferase